MERFLPEIPESWKDLLSDQIDKPYFLEMDKELKRQYGNHTVTPSRERIYAALSMVAPSDVKVVILGQDPYPTAGVANGLAFSVSKGTRLPQSLKNIYKELNLEYGYPIPETNGDLSCLERQGVLLLNTSLTTEIGKPNAHRAIGWRTFTDCLLERLSGLNDHKRVYLLFGNEAQKKERLLNPENSVILKEVHPSPLSASRGFFHSGCFRKVNAVLEKENLGSIDWEILDDRITLF